MSEKAYPHFFSASDLGRSFRQLSEDIIRAENQEIVNRWYHSSSDADLFIWLDREQNILKQQLSFYGQVIEWNVIDGVRTGCLLETEVEAEPGSRKMDSSELVRFDRTPQSSSVRQALELLKHMTVLSEAEKRLLMENFSFANRTAATMSPEEFLSKFGGMAKSAPIPRLSWIQRFWLRLIRLFR